MKGGSEDADAGLALGTQVLRKLVKALRPGGWLLTDLWNAEVVLADPPRAEVRTKKARGLELTQSIAPKLDRERRAVRLDYDIVVKGGADLRFTESLEMYLHDLSSLRASLGLLGFGDIRLFDRRHFPADADAKSWHVWLAARKDR